jgi:hypothetical protein
MSDDIAGDGNSVSSFQLYRAITELDRKNEERFVELDRRNEERFGDLRIQVKAIDLTITGKGGLGDLATDHESRIRAGERWKNALPVATLLFMATTTLGVIALFLRG